MVDAVRGGRNAAALAILALSALLLTPFFFQRSIARQRQVYTVSLDPARAHASDAMLAMARQIGSIRGYLLTRDTSLLIEYRHARAAQDTALTQLAHVFLADSVMAAEARALDHAAREWNASNDELAAGRITPAEAIARLATQQEMYRRALNQGEALEDNISAAVTAMRGRVGSLEHWWALATIALAVIAAGGAGLVIVMMRTSHRQSTLARTDPLTGLYNRLGFDELAIRELSRARRNASPITLMSFDIDHFKQVNDQRGHAAGDELLRVVGKAVRGAVRDIDVAGRLGGDEFAILLPDNRATPPERAVKRVRMVIMGEIARGHWPVTLSIGAVTVRERDISIDEMIHASDKLMYAVKNQGKDAMKHEVLAAVPAA
jgi:diguanylate cyclase (GGDEF)-like protein